MGRFLEQSLRGFVEQQKQLREQFDSVGKLGKGMNPLTMMTDMAEQNLRLWRGVQKGFKPPIHKSQTVATKETSADLSRSKK